MHEIIPVGARHAVTAGTRTSHSTFSFLAWSSSQSAPASCHRYALTLVLFCALLASPTLALPPASSTKSLQIYFVDFEGGQATLFVTPEGQSLLIDTGWPGNNNRDADRIVAAAKLAGITKIDYVLITHFHDDHVGGVPQLVARIPVGTFIDHGENRE